MKEKIKKKWSVFRIGIFMKEDVFYFWTQVLWNYTKIFTRNLENLTNVLTKFRNNRNNLTPLFRNFCIFNLLFKFSNQKSTFISRNETIKIIWNAVWCKIKCFIFSDQMVQIFTKPKNSGYHFHITYLVSSSLGVFATVFTEMSDRQMETKTFRVSTVNLHGGFFN